MTRISGFGWARICSASTADGTVGEASPAEPPLLDVVFSEDDYRIKKDNPPQNFAVLRHVAVNLLGKEKNKKFGIRNKQFLAAMDDKYLAKVLESTL